MRVFAVVPAYNEDQMIYEVVMALRSQVERVIVVDDGSLDKTASRAHQAGAVVIQHFLNRGQGAALKTGIDYALKQGAEGIITFDADGQHDVSDIKRLLLPITCGQADVVLGSRFISKQKLGMPGLRAILLRAAVIFTRLTTGLKVTDTHNGLRAFTWAAAKKIQIRQDGMAHASEILEEIVKHRLRFIEIPVSIHYTKYSLAKGQKGSQSFRILWDLFVGKISK